MGKLYLVSYEYYTCNNYFLMKMVNDKVSSLLILVNCVTS